MQKFLNYFKSKEGVFKKPMVVSPMHSWITILVLTLILVIIVVTLSWLLFFTNTSESVLSRLVVSGPANEFIKQEKLKKVLDAYKEKASKFTELSSTGEDISDPSL